MKETESYLNGTAYRRPLSEGIVGMKTLSNSLAAILVITLCSCVNNRFCSNNLKDEGGLTKAQWQQYQVVTYDVVTTPEIWKSFFKQSSRVKIDPDKEIFVTSNSEDGIQPPTQIDIHVPLADDSNKIYYMTVVFSHPSGEIRAIFKNHIIID